MFIPASAHRAECFSPYMTKKKALISFLSLYLLKKTKARVSFLFIQKDPPKTLIPPLPFSTSFQSHEKHQLTSPLHQPNQSIQLFIFLTPNKLSSSPASGSSPGRLRNALCKGQWSALGHERLAQEQNPRSLRQIDSYLAALLPALCPLQTEAAHIPHHPSRRPAVELR